MQGQTIDMNTAKLSAKNMQLRASNEEKSKIIIDLQKRISDTFEFIKNNSHKTEWGDLEQDNESIDINDDITDTEFIEGIIERLGGNINEY